MEKQHIARWTIDSHGIRFGKTIIYYEYMDSVSIKDKTITIQYQLMECFDTGMYRVSKTYSEVDKAESIFRQIGRKIKNTTKEESHIKRVIMRE